MAAKLLTRAEAPGIAANIAQLAALYRVTFDPAQPARIDGELPFVAVEEHSEDARFGDQGADQGRECVGAPFCPARTLRQPRASQSKTDHAPARARNRARSRLGPATPHERLAPPARADRAARSPPWLHAEDQPVATSMPKGRRTRWPISGKSEACAPSRIRSSIKVMASVRR
jgi:hypothetical protein